MRNKKNRKKGKALKKNGNKKYKRPSIIHYFIFGFMIISFVGYSIKGYYFSKEIMKCSVIAKARVRNYGFRGTRIVYYYDYFDSLNLKYSGSDLGLKDDHIPDKGEYVYIIYPCSDPSESSFVPINKSCSLEKDSIEVFKYAKDHNIKIIY